MDFEIQDVSGGTQNGGKSDLKLRSKSVLRMRYEAEVSVIRRRHGDLEQIRNQIGLTQRKMTQLLMVDPSAWTRWTKGGEDAPPHIYRMLQWYLALEDKYPALDPTFWLSTVAKMREPDDFKTVERKTDQLKDQHESLLAQLDQLKSANEMTISQLRNEQASVIESLSQQLLISQRRSSRQGLLLILAMFLMVLFVVVLKQFPN